MLTHLDMSYSDLCGDNAANMIMKIMISTKSLKYLNLSSCGISGDVWNSYLLKGIRDNNTIIELNLNHNRIFQTFTLKKLLADILYTNFSLVSINISNNNGMTLYDQWDDFLPEDPHRFPHNIDFLSIENENCDNTFRPYTNIEEDHRSLVIKSDKICNYTKKFPTGFSG
jgi:hypothetical protein